MDGGDCLGSAGVAGVAASVGDVGQDNPGCAYVSYIRKGVQAGLWISGCSKDKGKTYESHHTLLAEAAFC